MYTSRQALAAKQRNCNYKPSGTIAAHVLAETQYIDSTETVLELSNGFWVQSSKFVSRFYRATCDEQGQWSTSSHDERFAKKLVEQVRQYLAERAA